jgi:Glycosyl hydrolase 36 superfamily, catalytic domain/Glycosyltransferase family 36
MSAYLLSRGGAASVAVAVLAVAAVAAPGAAARPAAGAPGLLSAQPAAERIASSRGSGSYGRWRVDSFGLPAYDYRLDEQTDPRAAQPELDGDKANWSQLGNDAIVANAYNHGYVQLWSSARLYQWANRYDGDARHYAGGFGWLRLADGRAASTLYLDRPPGSRFRRSFGVGYAGKRMRFAGLEVAETTTSPYGDDPDLVDEVRITNRSGKDRRFAWWEYWDVNPYDENADLYRGLASPTYDAAERRLTVAQAPSAIDSDPLSIFLAAAPGTRVSGFDADTDDFFGAGSRALPAAVAGDRANGALAPPSAETVPGRAMFALRTPVRLRPGETVTLRYVYGIAHPDQIDPIVARAERGRSAAATSARRWARWLPKVDLGRRLSWLARELTWDAYMVRSSSLYEESCGHHVITQGGYYQYGLGQQIAFRDPLQHMLPIVYADPGLAREVLRYSLQQQRALTGAIEYGMGPMCSPLDLGTSNDLDFWLLQSVAEYVLATRDLGFLDERLPYQGDPAGATVWDHLKLAVSHQESMPGIGPAGNYLMGTNGDWSDFSTAILPADESVLVTAQLAYAYPLLARVADLRGDAAFADQLRRLGERDLAQLRREWTGRGWYARGYYGLDQVGTGAIYLEPQPWAIIAGAPDTDQAATLVGNVERYLQGRGAPPEVGGPTRIGTSQSPARADPDVTETDAVNGVGDGNAVFVGGTWYALNGTLAWALGELAGEVPGAARKAFDELKRNTLAAHADAFPDHWTGILNVDDACNSFYASAPDQCGINLLLDLADRQTNGQITHQPAWGLFAALRLAGIQPTGDGFRIAPTLPLKRFSIRLPRVGIEVRPGSMRGYVRTVSAARLRLELDPPGNAPARSARIWIDGEPARKVSVGHGAITVAAPTGADRLVDWALRY